jgi:hypothetical protein
LYNFFHILYVFSSMFGRAIIAWYIMFLLCIVQRHTHNLPFFLYLSDKICCSKRLYWHYHIIHSQKWWKPFKYILITIVTNLLHKWNRDNLSDTYQETS